MKSTRILASLALAGLVSACAHASNPGGDDGKRPPGPPPEAFEACEGLAEGDVVTFAGREGEDIEATCQEHDGKLVAVPKNPPRRH